MSTIIGLVSTFRLPLHLCRGKARKSPKKKSKLVGLDVYAEERHEKVQKGSRSMKKQKIQKISKKFKKAVDIILMW